MWVEQQVIACYWLAVEVGQFAVCGGSRSGWVRGGGDGRCWLACSFVVVVVGCCYVVARVLPIVGELCCVLCVLCLLCEAGWFASALRCVALCCVGCGPHLVDFKDHPFRVRLVCTA